MERFRGSYGLASVYNGLHLGAVPGDRDMRVSCRSPAAWHEGKARSFYPDGKGVGCARKVGRRGY